MSNNKNIIEAENILARYIPMAKNTIGKDITLVRMKTMMQVIGNPQSKLKIIHIAGTSGKTSTSYYVAKLFTLSGKKVGLIVSPHIDMVTERVQINMQPIDDNKFLVLLKEFVAILESNNLEPTYFELMVAFSYWYFAKEKVDYAVIETGLGGLHDSTNIADNADKVCVITDIGLDHTHVLGNTIKEIANQKAGIIHKGNQVFAYDQSQEVSEIIKNHADKVDANIYLLDQKVLAGLFVDASWFESLPNFQKRNWLLAYEVFKYISKQDSLIYDSNIIEESSRSIIPGRMEIIKTRNKKIIFDGAHNAQKIQAFVTSFNNKHPNKKVTVILSLKNGKDYVSTLKLLQLITDHLILTSYSGAHDNSISTSKLYLVATTLSFSKVTVEDNPDKALNIFLKEDKSTCIITGSFYLVSQLKQSISKLS